MNGKNPVVDQGIATNPTRDDGSGRRRMTKSTSHIPTVGLLHGGKTLFGHAQAHVPQPPCLSGPLATIGVHRLRFPREVIVLAVRWYLRYGLSYRDVEELVAECGVQVDQASGQPWLIPATHAGLVFSGVMPMLPYFVNRTAAAGVRASFDIRLRDKDSPRVRSAFDDGILSVSSAPAEPVDCHLSADPTTFLLLMYGRQGPIRPGVPVRLHRHVTSLRRHKLHS
jgi:hypothetical protein